MTNTTFHHLERTRLPAPIVARQAQGGIDFAIAAAAPIV